MLGHVLLPTDGSPAALEAARFAALLAPGARFTLFHVASDAGMVALAGLDAAAAAIGGAYAEWEERERMERERLSAEVLQLTRAALPPEAAAAAQTVSDHGRAQEKVLDRLETGPYDGAVVGSRGHGLLARALLGSVSDALVRHATKLVAIGRGAGARGILVGVDGSEPSFRACRLAADLSRRTGAPLTLLHGVEFPIDTYRGADRTRIEEAFRARAQGHFARARGELGGAAAAEQLVFHEPATALLHAAGQRGCDVIVLGRRGVNAASGRWAIGSVSLRTAMRSDASVVLVP